MTNITKEELIKTLNELKVPEIADIKDFKECSIFGKKMYYFSLVPALDFREFIFDAKTYTLYEILGEENEILPFNYSEFVLLYCKISNLFCSHCHKELRNEINACYTIGDNTYCDKCINKIQEAKQ